MLTIIAMIRTILLKILHWLLVLGDVLPQVVVVAVVVVVMESKCFPKKSFKFFLEILEKYIPNTAQKSILKGYYNDF